MNIHKKKLVVRGKLSNKLTFPLSYLGKRGRRFRVKMKFEGEPKVQSDIGRYERERERETFKDQPHVLFIPIILE